MPFEIIVKNSDTEKLVFLVKIKKFKVLFKKKTLFDYGLSFI